MMSREDPCGRWKSLRAQTMGCANRSENASVRIIWPMWNSEGCEPSVEQVGMGRVLVDVHFRGMTR